MNNEITAQRARDFKLMPQGKNENDYNFRDRIAGELREMGHLIEAHEALQNRLYDDPEAGTSVVDGVMGAMAQTMSGVNYRARDGEQQCGFDMAAGALVRHSRPPEERKLESAMLLLLVDAFGRR